VEEEGQPVTLIFVPVCSSRRAPPAGCTSCWLAHTPHVYTARAKASESCSVGRIFGVPQGCGALAAHARRA
jgi:hypothetical protein